LSSSRLVLIARLWQGNLKASVEICYGWCRQTIQGRRRYGTEEDMAPLSYLTQREQLVQAARRLDQSGVLSHSGHGNMSARLPEPGLMLLTSVSHLTHLTQEQSVIVTFDGEVVEGTIDPIRIKLRKVAKKDSI
jgi:hypothetical protein